MVSVTVAPSISMAVAGIDPVPMVAPNWIAAGTEPGSRASLKVTVIAVPLIAALDTVGSVVSAGVSLVTALAVKPGTRSIALSAALSLLVPGV